MCGACLPGYYEEILTDNKRRLMCLPKSEDHEPGHTTFNNYAWILVIFIIPGTAIPITYYWRNKYRALKSRNASRTVSSVPSAAALDGSECMIEQSTRSCFPSEDPLPTYQDTTTDSIKGFNDEVEVSKPLFHKVDVHVSNEHLQKARPFMSPDYENDDEVDEGRSINESVEEHDTLTVPITIRPPDIHDEETIPSEWTPVRQDAENQLVSTENNEPHVEESDQNSSSEDESPPRCKRQRMIINFKINNQVNCSSFQNSTQRNFPF